MDLHQRYEGVLGYLAEALPSDPLLGWIVDEIHRRGLPEIQISAEQGRLLGLLTRLLDATRILEIGTLAGYSTVWMARAMTPDGRLITLEANPLHAQVAREVFARAGLAECIDLRVGPALEALASFDGGTVFDLVFIDADKSNNRAYFDWALDHVRSGGLVVVDNVLANGHVVSPQTSAYGAQVHAFNAQAFPHCDQACAVVPFYRAERSELDGMLIYRVP